MSNSVVHMVTPERYRVRMIMEGMEWIDLAQDRDRWGAVVNEVMNLRIS